MIAVVTKQHKKAETHQPHKKKESKIPAYEEKNVLHGILCQSWYAL